MDFLNRAFAQASDLFRSMTPGARITAGLLLAVVVVSLGYLFNYRVTGGDTLLLGGQHFGGSELNAMQAAFGTAGLNDYELVGTQIRVPQGRQDLYLAALVDAGAMPADFNTYLDNAVKELGSPFMDRRQVEALMQNAKQNTIGAIIRGMSGVENAKVMYETKKAGGLHARETTTATVMVKLRGMQSLSAAQVQGIRGIVGPSIGLAPKEVTVVDIGAGGKTYTGGADDSPGAGGEHPYAEAMDRFKEDFRQEVLTALGTIPGVTVSVNMELLDDVKTRVETITYDPKTVPAITEEETSSQVNEPVTPGGAPGLGSQGGGANAPAQIASSRTAQRSEEETSRSSQQNALNQDKTFTDRIGLIPKRVSVAVVVPTSYFKKIWQEENPVAAGAEAKAPTATELQEVETRMIAKIRSIVEPITHKPQENIDPASLVSVVSLPDMPSEQLPEIGMSDKALGWFGQYWSTLGMIGLAMVSLVMLRSMVRSVPSPASAATSAPSSSNAPATAATDELPSSEAGGAPKKPKRKFGRGPNPRDDLVELVRDDPDAAAAILKGWIGNPT